MGEQAGVLREQRTTVLDGGGVDEAIGRVPGEGAGEPRGRLGNRWREGQRSNLGRELLEPAPDWDRHGDPLVVGKPGKLPPGDVGDAEDVGLAVSFAAVGLTALVPPTTSAGRGYRG
jgi:hypothetical protein